MVPAAFDYRSPASLDEALGLLGEHGDDAKLVAGGQSLIPLLKLRFAAPALLVDLARVPGLAGVEPGPDEIRIGARTRHVDVERDQRLSRLCPLLSEAAPQIADPLVRNRGTVGGSLCHADPSGDWGAVMLALDARLDARRRSGGAYLKLERKVGDFATVGVAVHVTLTGGVVERAGIGLTAVGPTNLRAVEAERSLAGREPTDEAISDAARLAAEAAQPKDDVRGSADYKRDVVRVFVQRGLRQALAGATGGLA